MIFSLSWQLFLLQVFIIHFDFTIQVGDVSKKTIDKKHEEIPLGTVNYYLNCSNGVSSIWKKNGQAVSMPLSCVEKSTEGKYTCHANENTEALMEITVSVKEKPPHQGMFCMTDYLCGNDIIPNPANEMSIRTINNLPRPTNECSIYGGLKDQKNHLDTLIQWKLKPYGTHGTRGWQIKCIGLDGHANNQYCAQINSKEKLNWTILAQYLVPGARYNITLQTLPESSSSNANSIFKIFKIPSFQDMCGAIGRRCEWEFCFPVENLTVTNYSSSPVVSWRPSPFYKSEHAFKVDYCDETHSDCADYIVENGVYNLTLTNLKHKMFGKYFIEVRPRFIEADDDGTYEKMDGMSRKLIFYTAGRTEDPPSSHILKIVISVSAAAVCLCILIILLLIRKRRSRSQNSEVENLLAPRLGPTLPETTDRSVDVLLVHDGHCTLCNNFTHSLANVFCETGRINCFLDLCLTSEISEFGIEWYQQQFKNCKKIVVICTKQSKHTYENFDDGGSSNNLSQRSFRLVLTMILGQMSHNNRPHVVPVYLDHSSREDIPNFLRGKQSYSLPSEVEKLLMSVSDLDSRQLGVPVESQLDLTPELRRKISQFKIAAQKLQLKHRCSETVCLINYARPSSSSSSDELVRV